MTDEEIRIAVARACGWTLENTGECRAWHKDGVMAEEAPPDYHTDLNAMHEAEGLVIEPHDMVNYAVTIRDVCRRDWIALGKRVLEFNEYQWMYSDIHATARQRAEAFLRVKGLWKNGL